MSTQASPGRVATRSAVMMRIGGRDYPMTVDPRCRTCASPYRFDVEQGIIAGRTYRRIIESLPTDSELSIENIGNHFRSGHLPAELSEARALVDARAQALGKSVEDATETLVDGITLLDTVVLKTFERIAAGEILPTPRDGLRAAKMLADLGAYDDRGASEQDYLEGFVAYHQAVSEVLSEDQQKRLAQMLNEHPVLSRLAQRYEEIQTVPGEVLSG